MAKKLPPQTKILFNQHKKKKKKKKKNRCNSAGSPSLLPTKLPFRYRIHDRIRYEAYMYDYKGLIHHIYAHTHSHIHLLKDLVIYICIVKLPNL